MTDIRTLRKGLGFAVICAGLLALPMAANAADASTEITTAATHAGFAAKSGTIKMVHTHMHHAINCLVGPKGNGFDKSALDPCKNSGHGAIPDTMDSTKRSELETVAENLRKGLTDNNLASAQKVAATAEMDLKKVNKGESIKPEAKRPEMKKSGDMKKK